MYVRVLYCIGTYCTVYNVQCTMYNVQCTMYNVHQLNIVTLNSVTMYYVLCTSTVHVFIVECLQQNGLKF